MHNEKIEEIKDFLRHNLYLITVVVWYILENLQLVNTQIHFLGHLLSTWDYRVFDWMFLAILLFIILFLKQYSTKEKIIIGIITILFAISVYISSYRPLMSLWLFIVSGKGEDFDRILKWIYYLALMLVICVVILCFLGVIQDITTSRGNGMTRHSLGFGHANTLGILITQLALYRIYIHRRKFTLWDVILTIADIVFVYEVPNSQTSYVSLAFALILIVILRITKNHSKWNKAYLWMLVAFCLFCNLFCLGISLTNSLNAGSWGKIDSFGTFQARAALAYSVYQKFGVHIFGTQLPAFCTTVVLDGSEYYMPIIDSSYMNLLLHCGMIVYLIYSILYLGTANWAQNGNPVLLIMFAVFAAHGIMEKSITELRHNLFLLAISLFLFSEDFRYYAHKKDDKRCELLQYSGGASLDEANKSTEEIN